VGRRIVVGGGQHGGEEVFHSALLFEHGCVGVLLRACRWKGVEMGGKGDEGGDGGMGFCLSVALDRCGKGSRVRRGRWEGWRR